MIHFDTKKVSKRSPSKQPSRQHRHRKQRENVKKFDDASSKTDGEDV